MGLFQHRPEEPTEWGGLPSEPVDPLRQEEQLMTQPGLDIPLFGPVPARDTVTFTLTASDLPASPGDASADGGDD